MNYNEYWEGLTELERNMVLLFKRIFEEVKPKSILEIGSGYGIFSRAVVEFANGVEFTTVDKIPEDKLYEYTDRMFGYMGRVKRITADSREVRLDGTFDLVFIDGDHGYQGLKADLEKFWPLTNKAVILDDIFHHYNWQPEGDDFNFGTTRAFWEFIRDRRLEAKVYPEAMGIVRIDK